MNKSELVQLKHLKKEIDMLKRQIDDADYAVESRTTSDSVVGSSPVFPYTLHTIKIHGVDISGYEKKVKRLRNQLKRRMDALMDRVDEANDYIASVPDSELRQVLQYRYINGLTWEQIEVNGGIPMTTAKRKFRRWRDFE